MAVHTCKCGFRGKDAELVAPATDADGNVTGGKCPRCDEATTTPKIEVPKQDNAATDKAKADKLAADKVEAAALKAADPKTEDPKVAPTDGRSEADKLKESQTALDKLKAAKPTPTPNPTPKAK